VKSRSPAHLRRVEAFDLEPKEIRIGMLGYGFAARAHINALKKLSYIVRPPFIKPKLVMLCGSRENAVAEAAATYGFERFTTTWEEVVAAPDIDLFINAAPNYLHVEPCIAAVRAEKHVLCEKPLAPSAIEAGNMLKAVKKNPMKHMCGFNYRFVPAIRLMREMIDGGELGTIFHFRARYFDSWGLDQLRSGGWRLDPKQAGLGAVGDIGSHIIDLARFLMGEIECLTAKTAVFRSSGKRIEEVVDDAFMALVLFENGIVGTLEGSRFCLGRKNQLYLEINGSKATVVFDLERMNELIVYKDGSRCGGMCRVLVTDQEHPFMGIWWAPGHIIGWEHTFVHQMWHLCDTIVNDKAVEPYGATFEDGYKCALICDALVHSAKEDRWISIKEYERNMQD